MKRRPVLVIDDEHGIRQTLSQILTDEGYAVETAADGSTGLAQARQGHADLIFLDVWLPDRDGLVLLEEIQRFDQPPPVVMISGHANVEIAVRAVKLGAADFLEKPLSLERVLVTAARTLERRDLEHELAEARRRISGREMLLGDSPAMQRLRAEISRVAPTEARVLITGENGTGKELVARAVHRLSPRAKSPLIEVNCAAIPEELIESELFGHVRGAFTGASGDRAGKFEEADGATLFLDEVGDMSARTQAKVLRALQEGRFTRVGGSRMMESDARIVSATNKNLAEEIQKGSFREDLFFRLSVVPLAVPPLRERIDDIPLLAGHFLQEAGARSGRRPNQFSTAALRKLQSYAWPGNVRELQNLAERLMIFAPGDVIDVRDLPAEILDSGAVSLSAPFSRLREAREDFERRFILAALRKNRGNVSRTAEELGLERSNFYRKLKSYGIDADGERE